MVSLSCVAIGNPDPIIQWWFDDGQLEDEVSETLLIPELTIEQRGRYSCTASGASEVVQSDTVIVNIQGKLLWIRWLGR